MTTARCGDNLGRIFRDGPFRLSRTSACQIECMEKTLTKRERLLQHIKNGRTDGYTPAGFFLHFGEDYKTGEPAIQRHKQFFSFTGMDFVKIQFELHFPEVAISGAHDFEKIPCYPLSFYEPQLQVVKGLVDALKSEAMVVLTLYSPLMITNNIASPKAVIDQFEKDPEPVVEAVGRVAVSLSAFVRECAKIGLDGFYHATQGGEAGRFSDPRLFLDYVKPVDLQLMGLIQEQFAFNILHICDYHQEYGGYASLEPFLDYPGHVVNVATEIGGSTKSPAEIEEVLGSPFMGGMNRLGILATGSEEEARAAARTVLATASPKMILAADCTVPSTTPWENLRAAISEAHGD